MRVISKKRLREFWERRPNAKAPLEEWYGVARKVKWEKFADVRATYPSADAVNQFVVFNIGGNKFRLIAFIDYEYGKLFVRFVLSHKEYEKRNWKKDEFGKNPQRRSKKSDASQTRTVPGSGSPVPASPHSVRKGTGSRHQGHRLAD